MAAQFVLNDKGETTSVIIPLNEYEDLLHHHHADLELTDDYKSMIDKMIADDDEGKLSYVTLDQIKQQFKK